MSRETERPRADSVERDVPTDPRLGSKPHGSRLDRGASSRRRAIWERLADGRGSCWRKDGRRMTQDPEKTNSQFAREEAFALPRRWRCFLLTIVGLITFIILVASFRAAVS